MTASSRHNVGQFAIPDRSPEEMPATKFIELKNTNRRVVKSSEKTDSVFTYHNITHQQVHAIPEDKIYRSIPRSGGNVSLALYQLDKSIHNEFYTEYGLKIQISLNDNIPGNVEKGWNAISPILRYYNIARTKVTNVDHMMKDDFQKITERGKQITIYASLHSPESNWKNILYSITKALLRKGVEPGYRPDLSSTKEVPNNCYLSYRFDMIPETGLYRAATVGSGAFPIGVVDRLAPFVQNIPTLGKTPRPASDVSNTHVVSHRFAR